MQMTRLEECNKQLFYMCGLNCRDICYPKCIYQSKRKTLTFIKYTKHDTLNLFLKQLSTGGRMDIGVFHSMFPFFKQVLKKFQIFDFIQLTLSCVTSCRTLRILGENSLKNYIIDTTTLHS